MGGFMTRPAAAAGFTPALGHRSLTGLYDAAIALMTRERVWRSALLAQLARARARPSSMSAAAPARWRR